MTYEKDQQHSHICKFGKIYSNKEFVHLVVILVLKATHLNSSGLLNIVCVIWQSHSCAACSSSQCSWRLWHLQHLRCGHVALFPGSIYSDILTSYGSCLIKKVREVLCCPLPFCPHVVVCSLFLSAKQSSCRLLQY